MDLHAGFAEVEISPRTFPVRTYWTPVDTVIDPLFAHAAVFHDGTRTIALLSLDVVIVEREYVLRIREQASRACQIPPDCIMVCATRNHACPAVVERPWSEKDHACLEHMVERAVAAIIQAYHAMVPVEVGTGTCYEGRVSFKGLIERGWYQWSLEKLRTLHARSDHEDAEIQVLRIGDSVFGAVPAEYFSQHSLRIKEQSPVAETFVVSLANGWLGYIPHKAAFDRIGGHESTWCISSKMEHEAGDRIADAMLETIRRLST